MVASAVAGLASDAGRRLPAGDLGLAHRRVVVLARRAGGRGRRGDRPLVRRRRTACRSCAPRGRRCCACCPPRCSAWCATTAPRATISTRSADVHLRRRQNLRRAGTRVHATRRLRDRRTLRHDRDRHLHRSIRPARGNRIGSIGQLAPGFTASIRDDDGAEVPAGTPGRLWIQLAQQHDRLLEPARRHRRDDRRRLARHGRPRVGRRGRLPLVPRPQEADHHPRRLEHLPAGSRRVAAASTRPSPAPAWSASTTWCTAKTCGRTSSFSPEPSGRPRPS